MTYTTVANNATIKEWKALKHVPGRNKRLEARLESGTADYVIAERNDGRKILDETSRGLTELGTELSNNSTILSWFSVEDAKKYNACTFMCEINGNPVKFYTYPPEKAGEWAESLKNLGAYILDKNTLSRAS